MGGIPSPLRADHRRVRRKFGAKPQDVDDVIQDVLTGFFAQSPTFVYDPSRGRFRGYLKVCTFRALKRRIGQNARFNGVPLEDVDPEAPQVDQSWNDAWERQTLSRAVDALRAEMGFSRRFRAFEQHVILNLPASDVARELGVHVNSVYRAKEQLSEKLKQIVARLSDED